MRFGRVALLAGLVVLAGVPAGATRIAYAGSGSGVASTTPAAPAAAGSTGTWTITYTATEDFAIPGGGMITIEIPAGWTAPQITSAALPGYVQPESFVFVDSITVVGRVIRVHVGAPPKPRFKLGDSVSIRYGAGGGPASAQAQTVAPASATFLVASDPLDTGSPALIASEPYVSVVPASVTHVRVVGPTGVPVGALSLGADQDTTRLYLQGYDAYENKARLVAGSWTVTGSVGNPAPAAGTGTVLEITQVGSGYAVGDSGAWADSTGLITVTHGTYGAVAISGAPSAAAGLPFAVSAAATDADGNTILSGFGSGAAVSFVAYADSVGPATADPDLVANGATLSGGAWSGGLTARRAGKYWMAVRDAGTGFESGLRLAVTVSGGTPASMAWSADTLDLVAGAPDTATVVLYDAFGNRAPAAANETLTLWTDRPLGAFTVLGGGAPIFELTVPTGADSASARFTDTGAGVGRIRAIDANGTGPLLGVTEAQVRTVPAAPAGMVTLTAAPDTLVANGLDSTLVTSGTVRDPYGNTIAAGERFTVAGTGLLPLGDDDPGTAGAQWTVGASGTLSGYARAGAAKGPGFVSVASTRGTAAGSVPVRLVAGPPAGAIALSAGAAAYPADSVTIVSISASALVDAQGNAVEDGEAYTVSSTLGAVVSSDQDPGTPGVQVRAASGGIAFQLFVGDQLGTATVSAVSVRGTANGSFGLGLVPGAIDAGRSSVTATSPATVGPTGSIVTVTLRDSQSHAVPGVPADSLAVSASGVPTAFAALGGATDASGSIGFRATTTVAGSATVSVTAKGTLLGETPTVVFDPGAVDHYVLVSPAGGPAGPLVSDMPESLHVSARDAFGNALPGLSGLPLRPTVLAGGAILPDSVLLAGGEAVVPFTPTTASPLSIQVLDDAMRSVAYGPVSVGPGAPYRVVATPPSPATLSAGDSTVASGLVYDRHGNAAPGALVTASVVAGGGSVFPASIATGGTGAFAFTLRAGGTPGAVILRLLAAASAAPDSVRADSVVVTVVPAGAATVQALVFPGVAAAGDTVLVTLTLRDAFGNVALSATPSLWIRTDTGTMSPDHVSWMLGPGAAGALSDSATSDGALYAFVPADQGVAVLRLRDTLAETIRVRAIGPGIPLGLSNALTVGAGVPAAIQIVSGSGQAAVVDHETALPLRARARDAFGNPAPGAVVRWSVVAGNGSVDAVRGGSADTTSTADASGVATCEVFRLGTVAGISTDAARGSLAASPAAFADFPASALPDTAFSIALSPTSIALTAGGNANVTATARDRFGNLSSGTPVTFYLGSPARGTLESTGATSGGPGSQSGVTAASGTIAVRYVAPLAAPAADSIFARGVSIGPAGVRADVSPAAAVNLAILPDSLDWEAGASVRVRVRALDAFGNPALADTATVVMRPSGSLVWSPSFGPLVAGEFVTFGRDIVAESVTLAADRVGGGAGSDGPAVVRAAPPAGAIPLAATRDTLTADGRSASDVTLGPVRDAYGNVVPAGTLLQVSATSATLVAPDASPLPGLDVATGSGGLAPLVLVAPAAPGPDTLRVASRSGSASGALAFAFTPTPSLAAVAASLAPIAVTPGQNAAFRVEIGNAGSGPVQIGAGTVLSFGSGAAAFSAALAAPVTIAPGGTDTLWFAATVVSSSLSPGTYAPALRTVGSDGTGAPFDFYPSLAGAQIHVAGVAVTPVAASPTPVPLGYADLSLVFDVSNPTALAAAIDGASVAYSAGAFTLNGVSPPLPAPLPAGGTTRLTLSVRVPSSGLSPGTVVDARLTASATFGGVSVSGAGAEAVSFRVESAAQIAAVPGGASPVRYLRGRTFRPLARVANQGAAGVTLAGVSTRLVLEHPGGSRLESGLTSAAAVPGSGGIADLAFDSLAVPAGVVRGRYGAKLLLVGTESGQAFSDTIPLDPDSVDVLEPPVLAVTGAPDPDTLSAGQARSIQVTLTNSGDVPFTVGSSTRLRLGAPLSADLAVTAPGVVGPGGTLDLTFGGTPVGSPGSPGTGVAVLEAIGLEDGVWARAQTLGAGSVTAQAPAVLAFVAGSTSPDTVRAGQSVDFSVVVSNAGGSAFTVDPTTSRLLVSDGVDQVVALGAGAPALIPPGGQAPLSFPSAAFPSSFASQAYPVTLVLHGTEWALADSATVASPPGEILVREPAAAVQVRALDAGAPAQVAPGASSVRLWGLETTPLVPPGGVTSARVFSVRLTVLADGAPAASAGTAFASIALRDAAGTIVAQAASPAGNPVTLALSPPLSLSAASESLWVEVAAAPQTSARTLALRLAAAADVAVLDDLTGTPVSVTGAGGLAFAPLTSPLLTLFTAAHGYPNPFHADREAIRLSYLLAQDGAVQLKIYTLLGDLVREVSLPAGGAGGARGLNEVTWDGRNGNGEPVRAGVYVARIEGAGVREQIKVGVLR